MDLFGLKSTRVLTLEHNSFEFAEKIILIDAASGIIKDIKSWDMVSKDLKVFDFGTAVIMPGIIDLNTSLCWDLGVQVSILVKHCLNAYLYFIRQCQP